MRPIRRKLGALAPRKQVLAPPASLEMGQIKVPTKTLPPEYLIQELARKASGIGKPLEKRLADLTVWFYRNRHNIPLDNLAAKQKFLETALWTSLEVNALLLERLHELEASKNGSNLWLPREVQIEGELSRFG